MNPSATESANFPHYSRREVKADLGIHVLGLAVALACFAWLLARAWPAASPNQLTTLSVYGLALLGMLAASAAYNLAPPGPGKALLRRLDHAMIFIMIAGTYTPFTLNLIKPRIGVPLCAVIWAFAGLGVALKLGFYRQVERASLFLYLGMGWLLLVVIRPVVATVPAQLLALLLAGGGVYSLGALVHARGQRIPFHNAIWHAMVLAAAMLHFAAVARLLPPAA